MISFEIPGEPVPQGRPRVTRTGVTYYDSKTKEYRELVKQCATFAQAGRESLTGALALIVDCEFSVPESWPEYRRQAALNGQWHTSRKDVDNVVKAVSDSCNGIIYDDDSQIAVVIGTKCYSSEPKTKVIIYELNEINNPRWLIGNLKRCVDSAEK
jgi:Holliday junction resolvase RusA-like endonuclease